MANGPRKELSFLDRALMNKAATQGGVLNFLGQQPEVTAPVRAQSHADSPPVQLAYITDAEKDLLVKSNIHGSMAGKPNPGPAGIESLDDFFNIPGGGIGGGSTADAGPDKKTTVYDSGTGQTITTFQPALGGGGQSAEDYGIKPGMAVGGDDGTVFQGTDFVPAPGQADKPGTFVPISDTRQEQLEALAEARRAQTLSNLGLAIPDKTNIFTDFAGIDTFIKNILGYKKLSDIPGFIGGFANMFTGMRPTVESFNDPLFLARKRNDFKTKEEFDKFIDDYKDLMEEAYAGQGDIEEEFKDRMESAFTAAQSGDLGTDAFRESNPVKYYEEKGMPAATGDISRLASLPTTGENAITDPELRRMIFEARADLDRMGKTRSGNKQGEFKSQPEVSSAVPAAPSLPVPPGTTLPDSYPIPGQPPFLIPGPFPFPLPTPGNKFGVPTPYNYYAQSPQYTMRGLNSFNTEEFNEQLRNRFGVA